MRYRKRGKLTICILIAIMCLINYMHSNVYPIMKKTTTKGKLKVKLGLLLSNSEQSLACSKMNSTYFQEFSFSSLLPCDVKASFEVFVLSAFRKVSWRWKKWFIGAFSIVNHKGHFQTPWCMDFQMTVHEPYPYKTKKSNKKIKIRHMKIWS